MPATDTTTLTLAHSPDPDDVAMWWPLGSLDEEPAIDTQGLRFDPLAEDISVLNERAIQRGDLDITAVSIQAYPQIKDRYRLTTCAGSFGENYGPKVVVRSDALGGLERPLDAVVRTGVRIAVPGINTTACVLMRMLLGRDFEHVVMRFDEIPGAVADGRVGAGVLIHDAQLTYGALGLVEVEDLGRWWCSRKGLPLPLGGNAIRRDLDERLGAGTIQRVGQVLRRSIEHALEHWEQGKDRIRGRYPDLDDAALDQYLRMYVSELTVDCGAEGRAAIELLLDEAHQLGLGPDPHPVDLVECG